MNCDIILDILGTKEATKENIKKRKVPFFIGKEESSLELSSIQDIAEFIAQSWDPQKGTKLLKALYRSPKKIDASSIYQKRLYIGNATIEYLKNLYSEIEEWDEISSDTPYNITLVDKAFINGKSLKGRVVGNGVVTHVIRSLQDAENFIRTELIRQEANKIIDGNDIKDLYLKDKYTDILRIIKNKHSKKIKLHILEINPEFDGDITISHLIEDFLNYKKDYQKIISYSEDKGPKEYVDAMAKLSDFCRELRKLQIFNEDSETPVARRLRAAHYKRERIGKKDMYETLLSLGTTELKNKILEIGLQNFINLDTEQMSELLSWMFADDPILSRYEVIGTEETKEQVIILTDKLVEALIKKRNKELPKEELVKAETLNTVAGVEDFFGGNIKYTTKEGQTYDVKVIEDGKALAYLYRAKKLSNNEHIKLKRRGRTLRDEFDFGYDTMLLLLPVDREGIVKGLYQSYYVFEYVSPKSKNPTYIVSRSVIHPDMYDVPKFASIKDAKLAIQGFIRSANISVHTDIEIKKNINTEDLRSRTVLLKHPVAQGQAISSIYYPINKDTKLNPQELKMFNSGNIGDVKKFYTKYGIFLDALDTAEKIGLFLYAMTEKGMTIENMSKWVLEEESLIEEARNVANQIIETINKAPVRHYLVESWSSKDYGYLVQLKALPSSKINSLGVIPIRKRGFVTPDTFVKTRDLHYIRKYLNDTIFAGTDISVEIKRKEEIAQLQTEELDNNGNPTGNKIPLFPDETVLDNIKAFVHDNSIYIIKELAEASDLIHETFHILFGAIKVANPELYLELIYHFYNDAYEGYKTFVNKHYENLAKIDKMEEVVVRSLAKNMTNGTNFFDIKNITEFDKLIFKSFINLSGNIKEQIKKINNNNDINFPTTIKTLISEKDNLNKMLRNRLITNIIQKGIANGTIKEEGC